MMSTPIDFSAYVMNHLKIDNLTHQHLVGPTFNLLKGTCNSRVELEYHFEECYKAVTDHLDWTNPEGNQYPFDLSNPLPLIEVQGRQVVPADYFINNDLEYLKGGSLSRKYTNSTTKTKDAKNDNIEGIADMVQTLWSPVKVAYDKYALWGISHWGPKRQRFYGFARHMKSTHDVYSRKRIIAVTHVKVMKKYDYRYLEEIEVRRDDNMLHKFKEGDFPNINLRDIEDMLLLLVKKKISNLERDVIFDLNVALRIFTRSIVILKRVEDLQLGVESYLKNLNITKPETFRSNISKLTPYTAYKNPQGIIYQDKLKRNKLMRSDELYKFCDSTLTSVRRVFHDIASSLEMDYLPKRTWSKLDRKRSRIMIKAINQQLFKRKSRWLQLLDQDESRFKATCSYLTDKSKDIMKAQYEHVGPEVTRSQEGKRSQNDDKRLCLVDDLKEAQIHIQVKHVRTSSSLKSKITTSCSQDKVKKTSLRVQD
ncbi:hypothetical protein Tco_0080383 [Tanacetum coccineum]